MQAIAIRLMQFCCLNIVDKELTTVAAKLVQTQQVSARLSVVALQDDEFATWHQ